MVGRCSAQKDRVERPDFFFGARHWVEDRRLKVGSVDRKSTPPHTHQGKDQKRTCCRSSHALPSVLACMPSSSHDNYVAGAGRRDNSSLSDTATVWNDVDVRCPPLDYWKKTYGFTPDQAWLDNARLASIRIPDVPHRSSRPGSRPHEPPLYQGMSGCRFTKGHELVETGYAASANSRDEKKCPDMLPTSSSRSKT